MIIKLPKEIQARSSEFRQCTQFRSLHPLAMLLPDMSNEQETVQENILHISHSLF
uniref:Reactive Intermediate Deaminase Aic-like n=1 Tax=Rhizophora mucronata TaxID=61149 RepID=A0A2P2JWP5_RHIMU